MDPRAMGMNRTSAPQMSNMMDNGPASKVGLNTQNFNNMRLAQQGETQNLIAGSQQAMADARMGVGKAQLLEDNAAYKANNQLETSKAMMLDAMDAPAIKALAKMNPLEAETMRKDMLITKASTMGMNPDLVA